MESLNTKKPVVLIVLDGWGYREELKDNAIAEAKTPNFDAYWDKYPHTLLCASGEAVGLPEGQMGNSEVGHMTIGAGAVMDTDLVKIKKAIQSGEFGKNPAFRALFDHVKKNNSVLHIQGLVSDGGVHSHKDHLIAFLQAAKEAGVQNVAIHVFTDGRDTAPQSAAKYLKELEEVIAYTGVGFIATLSGRLYAMDRDNNWDRVEKATDAIFECKGNICHLKQPSIYLEELYSQGLVDEKLEPIVFTDEKGEMHKLKENDGVFFFNFRPDRARMISHKIAEKALQANILFVTMTEYEPTLVCQVAFRQSNIETTMAEQISKAGLTQAHIAETEKFPHATYFLNGGKNDPYQGEEDIMLPSRKDVLTHDLAPKMQAEGIANKAIEQINKGTDFIFINIANPDMVGHTANVPAIVEAVEETDKQLGRIIEALDQKGGVAFITADHGNAEVNIDEQTGERHTSHTCNPVPVIITDTNIKFILAENEGSLADIAPTILRLLNITQPVQMTGRVLVQ
ncbi:MAG: 2,3-bisphosphoglycerate-independent phosphoglycerate mutase [Candidatus Vogelbacteria bacterium]|nr:2,3-bisphosphoglycerate-independent phosphoglycerate mutase [Candidatus Vogelbacteria bacterium]